MKKILGKNGLNYTWTKIKEYLKDKDIRTSVPVGGSITWYGPENTIPSDWMREDGRSLNKREYPDLFNVIGYTYGGSGDNFNIPDSRGRVNVHLSEDEEFNELGKKYGSKTTAQRLTGSNKLGLASSDNTPVFYIGEPVLTNGNGYYNSIQPSIVSYKIIRVKCDVYTKNITDLDNVVTNLANRISTLQTTINNLTNSWSSTERTVIGQYDGKPLYQQIVSRSIPDKNIQDPLLECPQDIDKMIDFSAYYRTEEGESVLMPGSTKINYSTGEKIATDISYLGKENTWKPNNLYFVLNGVKAVKVWAIIRFTSIND